jgi:hypothetical protein
MEVIISGKLETPLKRWVPSKRFKNMLATSYLR